jgi:hypothetical protein
MRQNGVNPQEMLAYLRGGPGAAPGQTGAVGGAIHAGAGPKGAQ